MNKGVRKEILKRSKLKSNFNKHEVMKTGVNVNPKETVA